MTYENRQISPANSYHLIGKHGFVSLIDYMGNDAAIANAARLSYKKMGVPLNEANDRRLIRRLVRDRHSSPVEMVEIKLHLKLPIFVMRQLIRHRTSSVNEMSGRYSVLPDEMYITPIEDIKEQSKTNKQGREDDSFSCNVEAHTIMELASSRSYKDYEQLLEMNVARETARTVLPLNIYTEVAWKQDLHNMLHLLGLRMDPHAQKEIRDYADAIFAICKEIAPDTVQAWLDYCYNAVTFSRIELLHLSSLLNVNGVNELNIDAKGLAADSSYISEAFTANELKDFNTKIQKIYQTVD